MLNSKGYYVSYLLRLRQVQTDSQLTWVASVQNTATGEQRCFTGVEMLVDFLRVEFGDEEPELDSDHPDGLLCEQVTISDGSERLLPL